MSLPTVVLVGPAALCVHAWRIAFGSVVFSVGLLALGRVGLFDSGVVIGLTAALALPGALEARRLARRPRLRDQEPPFSMRTISVFVLRSLPMTCA